MARWKALHELVKLDTRRAYVCKHCRRVFSREHVEHGTLVLCDPGGPPDDGAEYLPPLEVLRLALGDPGRRPR